MTAKTDQEMLAEILESIQGLRLEIERWRQHVGSGEHFMLVEIDRLIDLLKERIQ